jgi:hypothetical protein
MLTPRQQTAASLAHQLQLMGAWVTNAMPLDADGRLRFQVLDKDRNAILEKLASWDWSPVFVGTLPRVHFDGMKPASLYEIDLPRERQAISQDTRIYGEIAEKKKTDAEIEGIRRYLDGYHK